jgi:hypothetical protein
MRSFRLSYAIPLAAAVAASFILIRRNRRGRPTDADADTDEYEIRLGNDQVNYQLLKRLRCNDPTLKKLSLCFPSPNMRERNLFCQQFILPAIEAIGTNTFLEKLDMEKEESDGPSSSVDPKRLQNLQTLVVSWALVDDITAIVEALPFDMKLKTLMLCQWRISHDGGTFVVAGAFHRNQTLKTLCILCGSTIPSDVAALVVEGLSMRRRELSFYCNNLISREDGARILQILKEKDHLFNKIELFAASKKSDWQNEIRLEVEKYTWARRFLKISDTKTQQVLLPSIIQRAEMADHEGESKGPDMVFYILKETCNLFGSSMDDKKKSQEADRN